MDLNIVWFLLIGFLLVGYAILDGYDLGTGMHHFFVKRENDKQAMIKAIAPFWDGNEVWLLTGGGAIFAAFPHVYATVFSGFYLAMITLLVALIFRALSIEFRNEVENKSWQKFWDKAFSISSFLAALLLGIALGNIYTGLPIDGQMNFTGSFFTLLRPIPLCIGISGVFMMATQGAAFQALKTSSYLQKSMKEKVRLSWFLFLISIALTIMVVAITDMTKIEILFQNPFGYLAMICFAVGVISLPLFLKNDALLQTFLASSLIIISMFLIVGVTIFPNMVPALDLANSLTIYNASSSQKTLTTMLFIALIGMPIVIFYTVFVYRVFRKGSAR